jgi:chromosome segregation protein
MENFKSFGKKLTVPFFQGFTAITGPNGSGKSNIADAILFVLGPKSSKVMRAGRLTDLIFNGGKKHKNPSKYCKVSLVFDNSERKMPVDSDEVILTRMIKRAPIKNDPNNYYSKFYVNGKSSSFSEFENILLHARMSGDGYNIVKQGDVTNLIEMGNVDRRRLIDDIAGISNFDNDIKKAEKEETEVDSNLERIKIILNEISAQIRQLKNDRDEAYRYKELKDKLYEIKAKIALKKKQDIQSQIAEVQKQIDSYEKEKEKLDETSKNQKLKYLEAQKELEEIEKKIGEVGGDEVKEIKEKIDKIRSEEIKISERLNYSNDEIQELQNEVAELSTNLESVDNELAQFEKEKEEINAQIKESQDEFDQKDSELTNLKEDIAQSDDKSMDLSHELAKMREEFNEKNSEIHELKLKRNRFTDKIEALELQIAEMQETKNTYEFEIKDIDWQKDELKKEFSSKSKKTKDLEKKLFDHKKQESEITKQLTELENAIRRLQREQAKLQAEYDAMESVNSKYNRAVTEVLKLRDTGVTGIHGTIAELANVDKKYETAVEIAAGGRMQSIVVDSDEIAAKAIKHLQKQKLGRATFLPLNKMIRGKPRGKALMAIKDEKAHGFAFDLVEFKDKYEGAFWYVFGDTIIVDSLDDARRLMGGVRLVDLKGSLIESSGAMVGGSRPKSMLSFSGVDREKLDKITIELNDAIAHQEKLSNELGEIKNEIQEIESNLGTFKTETNKEMQVKDFEIKKKEFSAKLEILNKELDEKIKEKDELADKKSDVLTKIEEYKKRIEELEKYKEEKGKLLLKGTKKELAQKARGLEEEVTSLQESILTFNSEKEATNKKIELLDERKKEINTQIKQKNKDIENFKNSIQEQKESRSKYRDELKALMQVEEKMTGKIKNLTQERDKIYKKTVSIENELDKLNTRVESYYDLISRAKYRLPTLEDSISEIDQELKLYNVDINQDEKLPNVESLKDSMKVTEESMRELEPVNMRALDEYEHQSERKKKLDEDVKHLKDQKKNLTKLVKEITSKKKERFFEVFDQINKNFKEMYAKLSEGGEAELELEDEEKLFESGLTIKARPRGKKVLLLSALSGGEKSIASIAFIFAIQKYAPSPFYVLDEVDMFLDGVNAETVSRMVKDYSQDSQFIMVSLRKVALKEANHVYGVTMRDTGVSEMIGNIDPSTVSPKGEFEGGKMIATTKN